ncbi:hypothetical protein PybrP1_006602 [[Pythium] brassicae (nom. inval.)]|nr:hypothetical protein PybrP1_006602 [[Pythium] brassicae (nom. inval.)]
MTRTVASSPSSEAGRAHHVRLSDAQTTHFRRLAHEVVDRTLKQEMRFRYTDNEALDESEWKLARSKERMRVYKRAAASPAEESSAPSAAAESRLPMTLGLGSLEGTVEEVLYGMHHTTTHEMRSVATFLNKATPGPGKIIKDRSALTLEFMGIDVDANGTKYGFQLMRSQLVHGAERRSTGPKNSADDTPVSKATRSACSVCFKKRFFLAPTRQRCRLCAKTVCAKCCIKIVLAP